MTDTPQSRARAWVREAADNPHVRLSPGIAADIEALCDLADLAVVWPEQPTD